MIINVGDLIYVLDVKVHTVVPCKVIEKISSIRIEGEEVHHIAETPTGKNFKLESCKNPWFTTIEASRDFLKSAAEKLITGTIQRAQKIAESSFGEPAKNESIVNDEPALPDLPQERLLVEMQDTNKNIQVDLGSGQVVNVSLPSELLNAENTSS